MQEISKKIHPSKTVKQKQLGNRINWGLPKFVFVVVQFKKKVYFFSNLDLGLSSKTRTHANSRNFSIFHQAGVGVVP